MTNDFWESVKKQLNPYKMLGEKTFFQLSSKEFFVQLNEESNSIDRIIKRLSRNTLLSWTDFLARNG